MNNIKIFLILIPLVISFSVSAQESCDTNPASCITNGLVGHWSFDEGTGTTAYDGSGLGNNGTLNVPQWTSGKIAGALDFDGIDDSVYISDSNILDGGNTITIMAWIYARSGGEGDYGRIITKGDGNPYSLLVYKGSAIYFTINGNNLSISGTSYGFNAWHHIVGVYESGLAKAIYVDGVFAGSEIQSGNIVAGVNNLIIGNRDDTARTFDGLIDDVRIYNRSLSAAEIEYHYNHGVSVPTPSPLPTPTPTSTPTPTPTPSPTPTPISAPETNVGNLVLSPTIENIGVVSVFSGDNNADNQAKMEYRENGASVWKAGITMTVDRREMLDLTSDRGGDILNPYKDQARAVIFGLKPNTQYEVRVTYADPDGVVGEPAVTTVKTLNDNPPSNGNVYHVSTFGSDSNIGSQSAPFRTIQKAANVVQAGDTVIVMPGIYTEQVNLVAVSGQPGNYITFRSYDLNNKAVVEGEGTREYGFKLDRSSYIRISGLELRNTTNNNLYLGNGSNYAIIEDNILTNGGSGYYHGGILVISSYSSNPTNNALIQRNRITRTGGTIGDTMGIFFANNSTNAANGGHVVRDNFIGGAFKDGVGGSANGALSGGVFQNTFIYRNTIEGTNDDGIEIESADINSAVWENTIRNTRYSSIGICPVIVGPIYIFRNVLIGTDYAFKMGGDSFGYAYIYHNNIYNTTGRGVMDSGHTYVVSNMVFLNNVFYCSDETVWQKYVPQTTNSYNYNIHWRPSASNELVRWGAESEWPNVFRSLAQWQSGYNQELKGINADPQYVNPVINNFHLQSTSPAIDKGVVLLGFNDTNSPWPYRGTAPDIGAYEYDSGAPPPVPTIVGDIWGPAGTKDGKVNIYDVSRLMSKWGSTNPADLQECDINSGPGNISQSKVDLFDANIMMKNWLP